MVLADEVDNGNRFDNGFGSSEALYVGTLRFEDASGLLNLNGLHLYYMEPLIGNETQIICGVYADLDGNCETDLDDLTCMMEGLSGVFDCLDVVVDDLDIAPCGGNGELNLHDLISMLDTLGGSPPCPDGCL